MNAIKTFLAATLLFTGVQTAQAQDFFDTSSPDKLVSLGVRAGINTSNQTSPEGDKELNLDSWGTGFTAGAVVDLNFRDFFAIQPGVFFESRSHNYSYMTETVADETRTQIYQYGHTRSTWLKIPLLASFRFNPAPSLRWAVEAGPVFGFGLGGHNKVNLSLPNTDPLHFKATYFDSFKKWSFALKFGTTLRYADHYLIGIHYEAGTSQVFKHVKGGHHKAWTFTLGYDF